MEKKYIKYKLDQLNLAKIYKVSYEGTFDNSDVEDGTLVIGHSAKGKYLCMGYLRGIRRSETDAVLYEIANAVSDEPEITFVHNPCRVNNYELPFLATKSCDKETPAVGRVYKCNGELAVMNIGCGTVVTVNVKSIFKLVPYFKETN